MKIKITSLPPSGEFVVGEIYDVVYVSQSFCVVLDAQKEEVRVLAYQYERTE